VPHIGLYKLPKVQPGASVDSKAKAHFLSDHAETGKNMTIVRFIHYRGCVLYNGYYESPKKGLYYYNNLSPPYGQECRTLKKIRDNLH
jgi:hypothetical protein